MVSTGGDYLERDSRSLLMDPELFSHTLIEHKRLLLSDLYHYEIAVFWVKYKVEFMRNDC